MALIKTRRSLSTPLFSAYNPFPAFDDLENRMKKFFEGTVPFEGATFGSPIVFLPPTEIAETDSELVLTIELPGLEKKDVNIALEDGVLTVSGEKFEEKKDEEDKKFYLFERTYGSFNRSFTLPHTVDYEKIGAEFEKGVLKIHMPKTAEAKVKGRKIEIAAK